MWLRIVSGQPSVDCADWHHAGCDASRVACREADTAVVYEFAPHRYGFLFVADGKVEANGETLQKGDAVRLYDVQKLAVKGHGELVLWDVPRVD